MFSRFVKDRRGNFAVITALCSVVLFGMVGLAVDYVRLTSAKSFFQDEADAIGVAIAATSDPTEKPDKYVRDLKMAITEKLDNQLVGAVSATAVWIGKTQVQVDVSATVSSMIMHVVSPSHRETKVAVTSLVNLERRFSEPAKPEKIIWEGSAVDYNRIYAYCYKPATGARTQETPVMDNANTNYEDRYEYPVCGNGEFLSYKLHSVENARYNSRNWERNPRIRYADTWIDEDGAIQISGGKDENGQYQPQPQLETVMCPSLEKCKPKSQGGIIPEGTNRTPRQDKMACAPGKYFYYGWEDRPYMLNGQRYGDNDFDDIILVMPCDSGPPIEEKPRIWIGG
ncbi:TadE/TadG family type IV pilus assembly protein [Limoniibacter endophyticus]|uniref:Putative Flp pilus-assembly TadG-like N-terminal domain-containing protein n=1 Tax=Limoniibacter endophyticus TaxID=1565040 RepID=A0A8J3DUM9_9HYPH|nr:TadE/TadG family type IV pilus assembly protein [Limoniibacter endophyticus]GHC78830.1 hypothetical protein GCM10010136_30880 [Limoniibacter endophyticus]